MGYTPRRTHRHPDLTPVRERRHDNLVYCLYEAGGKPLHGDENMVGAEAGYTGVEKRPEHKGREVIGQIAARRSAYKKLDKRSICTKHCARPRRQGSGTGQGRAFVPGDQAPVGCM